MNEIINYNDGEIELKVSIENETVWLSQAQMRELFQTTKQNISLHINNIYKEGELEKESTIKDYLTVRTEGNRKIKRKITFYNLDVIISVGYRVKSQRGVKFRQWATSVLKEYIYNGYAINQEKITQQRVSNLEKDVEIIKKHIKNNSLELTQGIFYNGQIFDAYAFINDLLRDAKQEVILIDNYIDDTVLTIFSKYPKLNFIIVTKNISKQLKLDIEKYNSQYNNLKIETSNRYHDRFLIIDNQTYHIGASLKDLGKKVFAFSKLEIDIL